VANEQNLKLFTELTEKERREMARKAGKASGEARRRKRDMKESIEALFAMQTSDKYIKAFKKQGFDVPENLTNEQAMAVSMVAKSIAGDTRAANLVMDILGEKHHDKMKERELELREKQANDMKSEALTRLDSILEGLRDEAQTNT
jgi:hypothetical protein